MRNSCRHRQQLPDYQAATQQANLQRRKLQYSAYHARSHSYDGVITDVLADQHQGEHLPPQGTANTPADLAPCDSAAHFYRMGQDEEDEREELVDGEYMLSGS